MNNDKENVIDNLKEYKEIEIKNKEITNINKENKKDTKIGWINKFKLAINKSEKYYNICIIN